ncbi:MAG: hypothetical protein COA42_01945 [Alteromonadaceae bacterium]|nr:MAG: hypothetical protein COA42_01945 [Alteromonadaceae bacterium]
MVVFTTCFKSIQQRLFKSLLHRVLLLSALSFLGACSATQPHSDSASSGQGEASIEYASFYAETQGEFTAPINVDAPTLYSWATNTDYIKGNIDKIWAFHKIIADQDDSFNYIEITLLNHLAAKGWRLEDMEIVSIPMQNSSFRTAYRYLFSRQK